MITIKVLQHHIFHILLHGIQFIHKSFSLAVTNDIAFAFFSSTY